MTIYENNQPLKESKMRILLLGTYTPNALQGLMSGSDRKAAVEAMLDKVGGSLEHLAFTRGEYDVVVTAVVPDNVSLPGIGIALKASGAFEKAVYLEELEMTEVLNTAKNAATVYTPATTS